MDTKGDTFLIAWYKTTKDELFELSINLLIKHNYVADRESAMKFIISYSKATKKQKKLNKK